MSNRAGSPRHQTEEVVFVRATRRVTESIAPGDEQFSVPMDKVKDAWREVTKQLAEIISATDQSMLGKYKLAEVAVGIKLGAKGKLFGLAEASAEASIVVKIVPL